MGVIAGVIVAAGAAAYSAHEANQNAKNQANATNEANQRNLDSFNEIQKQNSEIYKKIALAIPDVQKLNLAAPTAGYSQYNQQRPYIQNVSNTARTLDKAANKNYQGSLSDTSPDLIPAISKLTSQARSFLGGDLPKDVSDLVVRKAAERAAAGGYGIDSGMGRNLVSRDLGLTSLDMIGRGAAMMPGAMSLTQAVNPFQTNVSSLFFTPEYLQNRQDAADATNWGVDNENKNRAFQRVSGVLASKLKSMPPNYREAVPELHSPVAAGLSAAASAYLGSSGGGMGGMGGGGGGANVSGAVRPDVVSVPTGSDYQGMPANAVRPQVVSIPTNANGTNTSSFDWSALMRSISSGYQTGVRYNG